jgi:hypothetical protein
MKLKQVKVGAKKVEVDGNKVQQGGDLNAQQMELERRKKMEPKCAEDEAC